MREKMSQEEKRIYLIQSLLQEYPQDRNVEIPKDPMEQKRLLRALFNIRMPKDISSEFLLIQDEYLLEETKRKGITDIQDLQPAEDGIYLWKGDITTLKCGAIVNAANSGMLGCFHPNHGCIDNCIHTYAGIQLRQECARIMEKQRHEEETGTAKLTSAWNLPCDYILHTVGPVVQGILTKKHEEQLTSSYLSCLKLAKESGIKSVAFCCISTGVFGFPQKRAAEIAVETVRKYKGDLEVIFNVFTNTDERIYRELLGSH